MTPNPQHPVHELLILKHQHRHYFYIRTGEEYRCIRNIRREPVIMKYFKNFKAADDLTKTKIYNVQRTVSHGLPQPHVVIKSLYVRFPLTPPQETKKPENTNDPTGQQP